MVITTETNTYYYMKCMTLFVTSKQHMIVTFDDYKFTLAQTSDT